MNRFSRYFLLLIFGFSLHCFFLSWSFLFQNVDDAYISYRYGRNLMEGNGLVYNPGEKVEGYTNFLWTVITAPFTNIPSVDVSIFSNILCFIISIFNIYLIILISSSFRSSILAYSKYFVLIPAVFFALDGTIAFWVIGGMELPLFTLSILGLIYNYFRLNTSKKYLNYMIFFAILATLTRPEGNMIFGITILHMLIFRNKIKDFNKVIIQLLSIYLTFLIIYYGFKYIYYGQILPNTFYAKGVTDLKMNLILGTKYIIMCIGLRLYIFIFILFIPFIKAFKGFKLSYLILFSGIYILYIILVGGDWMYANRFFVPIIPLMYILSTIGIFYFFKKVNEYIALNKPTYSTKKIRKSLNIIISIISLSLLTLSFLRLEYKTLIIDEDNARFEKQWQRFGEWLNLYCDPNTIIAVGPAGKIPYYSRLYSIDMWGLNNEFIARTESKRLQAGHKKYDIDYVLSLNPEFIIGYAGFTDSDIPERYEKFNPQDDYYKCMDIVFRLKKEYRILNKDN